MTQRFADDVDLVRAVSEGSREHFGALVDKYFPMVYAIAYGGSANHAEAEDVMLETFIRAFRKLGGLRDAAKFPA